MRLISILMAVFTTPFGFAQQAKVASELHLRGHFDRNGPYFQDEANFLPVDGGSDCAFDFFKKNNETKVTVSIGKKKIVFKFPSKWIDVQENGLQMTQEFNSNSWLEPRVKTTVSGITHDNYIIPQNRKEGDYFRVGSDSKENRQEVAFFLPGKQGVPQAINIFRMTDMPGTRIDSSAPGAEVHVVMVQKLSVFCQDLQKQ